MDDKTLTAFETAMSNEQKDSLTKIYVQIKTRPCWGKSWLMQFIEEVLKSLNEDHEPKIDSNLDVHNIYVKKYKKLLSKQYSPDLLVLNIEDISLSNCGEFIKFIFGPESFKLYKIAYDYHFRELKSSFDLLVNNETPISSYFIPKYIHDEIDLMLKRYAVNIKKHVTNKKDLRILNEALKNDDIKAHIYTEYVNMMEIYSTNEIAVNLNNEIKLLVKDNDDDNKSHFECDVNKYIKQACNEYNFERAMQIYKRNTTLFQDIEFNVELMKQISKELKEYNTDISWKNKFVKQWSTNELTDWIETLPKELKSTKKQIIDECDFKGIGLINLKDNEWSDLLPTTLLRQKFIKAFHQRIFINNLIVIVKNDNIHVDDINGDNDDNDNTLFMVNTQIGSNNTFIHKMNENDKIKKYQTILYRNGYGVTKDSIQLELNGNKLNPNQTFKYYNITDSRNLLTCKFNVQNALLV